jgi:hypothetical protein
MPNIEYMNHTISKYYTATGQIFKNTCLLFLKCMFLVFINIYIETNAFCNQISEVFDQILVRVNELFDAKCSETTKKVYNKTLRIDSLILIFVFTICLSQKPYNVSR